MSKADEMFFKLEYEKVNELCGYIIHYHNSKNNCTIEFNLDEKTIRKTGLFTKISKPITMQELKAINEKVKELKLK